MHPNIIRFIEWFQDTNFVYFVHEFMSAGTLAERLTKVSAFPESAAAEIARQMLSTLKHAQSGPCVFGNYDPYHIFFVTHDLSDPTIKSSNMALAKLFEDSTVLRPVESTLLVSAPGSRAVAALLSARGVAEDAL